MLKSGNSCAPWLSRSEPQWQVIWLWITVQIMSRNEPSHARSSRLERCRIPGLKLRSCTCRLSGWVTQCRSVRRDCTRFRQQALNRLNCCSFWSLLSWKVKPLHSRIPRPWCLSGLESSDGYGEFLNSHSGDDLYVNHELLHRNSRQRRTTGVREPESNGISL